MARRIKKMFAQKNHQLKHENLQNVIVNFMYEEKMESKRNWVFATNSNSIIPISLQPDGVDLTYFKRLENLRFPMFNKGQKLD